MATQLRSISRMVRGERPTFTGLILEKIVLRHQIAVLERRGTRRACFRLRDRMFWILLARWWSGWRDSLVIVQPATVGDAAKEVIHFDILIWPHLLCV